MRSSRPFAVRSRECGAETVDQTQVARAAAPALDNLTIGYSTTLSRWRDIELPCVSNSQIVVVVQHGDDEPGPDRAREIEDTLAARLCPSAQSVRLTVVLAASWGVARSRNLVLSLATRRYLLFSDDDVRIAVPGVATAIDALERTGAALALGRAIDSEAGRPRKHHPTTTRRLNAFNSARAATYEMLVDVPQVRSSGVRFDERFGAGARLYLGDEYILIADLVRAGRLALTVPHIVAEHTAGSSGSRWGTDEDRAARAAAIARVHGRWSPLVQAAFATRHARDLASVSDYVSFVRERPRQARPPHAATAGF